MNLSEMKIGDRMTLEAVKYTGCRYCKENQMDLFKAKLFIICDVGGLRCPCCNPTIRGRRNNKKMLRRIARRMISRETKSIVKLENLI